MRFVVTAPRTACWTKGPRLGSTEVTALPGPRMLSPPPTADSAPGDPSSPARNVCGANVVPPSFEATTQVSLKQHQYWVITTCVGETNTPGESAIV